MKVIDLQKGEAHHLTLPDIPGVYFFKDKNSHIIYIGKAKNLKSRVSSYFASSLGAKTAEMVKTARFLTFIKVASELEAILLEANLIRAHLPKYNIALKDDKSPLYIGITKEAYPRVIALRKTQIGDTPLSSCFGPYSHAGVVKRVLKYLRRIIPYSNHKPTKRVCIYRHIGQCYPCPSEIENTSSPQMHDLLKKNYLKNIRLVKKFLNGKLTVLKRQLEKDMKEASRNLQFEEAHKILRQLKNFEYVTKPPHEPFSYIQNPNFLEDIRAEELANLKSLISPFFEITSLTRIECFDIAHLSGSHATASMVVFTSGEKDSANYRHFKIRFSKKTSDVDMMKEVLTRRLRNVEWGTPDLIIVDGGKPQVTAALHIVPADIPLIGLAKRYETIVIKTKNSWQELRVDPGPALNLLQRIRDEAHRFARRLHHKHVLKSLQKGG